MTEKTVQGPASYLPSIEKEHGRPIAEWRTLLRSREGYAGARHMELVSWLKDEHEMGHGHADALVAHTVKEDGR